MRSLPGVIALLSLTLVAPSLGGLVDPTLPPAWLLPEENRAGEAAPPLSLDAVVVSGEKRFAVINETRVRVGDFIDGSRVLSIEVSGVRLEGAEGEILLTLSGVGSKQPSDANRSSP